MKIKIKAYFSFKYLEVYKIIQWKDGCIFKTKRLNKFVAAADEENINTDKFVTTSISTSMTQSEFIVLDVEESVLFS